MTDLIQSLLSAVHAHFPESRAKALERLIVEIPPGANFWNMRKAKAEMAKLFELARAGKAQLVTREGDDLPVLVISLATLCDVAERGVAGTPVLVALEQFLPPVSVVPPLAAGRSLKYRERKGRDSFEVPALAGFGGKL